ncbi:hypothetical protein Tco_0117307 [Tanacetum coccineum]
MFEREKLFGANFNDWFRSLKLVLRVEKNIFVIEQPVPPASPANSAVQVLVEWNALYDVYNEVVCLMIGRFIKNYNMHNMGKTIGELHALLIEYEKGLSKKAVTPQGKDKLVYIPKPKNPIPSAKEHLAKDDACHHCKEVGNWKRNYLVYLDKLIKKKKQVGTTSSLDIFTIELFSFPNKSWVYDTSCGTHICNTKYGLRGVRRLKQGAIYLYVGNGVNAQVEAIGSFDLSLPNGLVICLEKCHYAPTITRGVVSVSRLVDNGFI